MFLSLSKRMIGTWRGSFENAHVLSAGQFTKGQVMEVVKQARFMEEELEMWKKKSLDLMKGEILGNLFFEPSTRTASSFATAMTRLGGSVLNLSAETSSSKKGESVEDTIR